MNSRRIQSSRILQVFIHFTNTLFNTLHYNIIYEL